MLSLPHASTRLGRSLLSGLAGLALVASASGCGLQERAAGAPRLVPPESAGMLRGLPQDGITLGRPDAPATVTLFDAITDRNAYVDRKVLPAIADAFVRTGKARLQLRTLTQGADTTFGLDGVRATSVAQTAGLDDHFWDFWLTLRRREVSELDDQVLRAAWATVPGLGSSKAYEQAGSKRVAAAVARAGRAATAAGVRAPALVVTHDGRMTARIDLSTFPAVPGVVQRVAAGLR